MPDNPKIQNNVASILPNGSVDNIQEGISRMKIEKKEGETKEYPNRPGEPDCIYYLRTGLCGYGTNCRFNHPPFIPSKTVQNRIELPQREGQPDCGYYLKTGTCKYSSSCKYNHPPDRRGAAQVTLNTFGLPIRQEEKPCPYYMRTYTCKFGPACKFDHPQPAPLETGLHVPGPTSVAIGIGSTLPPTGIPYVGPLPAWQVSRSSNAAPSLVPDPQTYMPLVFPPLQTPLTPQPWNTYMGNLSSIPASDMIVPVYNSKSQGELVTGGSLDLLKQAISNLPERPDQPVCRYFMSTGSCKYGPSCKFHHPKEKMTQNLGPHGLPFRPGEELCGYFSTFGVCKFGPTCKFDHPMYVTSYFLGMPSIPMVDLPFFPSARNMVISNVTETSQSKSSNITDWIQKPENISDKNRQNATKKSVDLPPSKEVHDDHPNNEAAPESSEVTLDKPE